MHFSEMMDCRVKPGNDVSGNSYGDNTPVNRHILSHAPIPSPPDRLPYRRNRGDAVSARRAGPDRRRFRLRGAAAADPVARSRGVDRRAGRDRERVVARIAGLLNTTSLRGAGGLCSGATDDSGASETSKMDCFVASAPRNDGSRVWIRVFKQQIHVHILAAGDARGLRFVSLKLEGAGNAGGALHRRSRVQKAKRKTRGHKPRKRKSRPEAGLHKSDLIICGLRGHPCRL
jgi:hypothetical protein